MRKHHRKKSSSIAHPRIAVIPPKLASVDNTQDIDFILSRSKLFQELLGVSGERLGGLFETAIAFLQQHRYEEALQGFQLLTQLNPYISDFWLGLGLAKQAQDDLSGALSSFLVAQTMDPDRADPYIYAVDCCLEMNNQSQAQAIIKEGLKHAKKHPRLEDSKVLIKELPLRLKD